MSRKYLCWNCGDDMGEWDRNCHWMDTCGQQECERAARDQLQAEREEAHEQLDRDLGYY